MRVEVVFTDKTHIVGGDHRQIQLGSQIRCQFDVTLLVCLTNPLQFQVKTVRKQIPPIFGTTLGLLGIFRQQGLTDVAVHSPGQNDQPLMILGNPFLL